jgi:hypothetical protein
MGTFRDLPRDKFAKRSLIHLSALHGRNQGRDGTSYSFAHIAHRHTIGTIGGKIPSTMRAKQGGIAGMAAMPPLCFYP